MRMRFEAVEQSAPSLRGAFAPKQSRLYSRQDSGLLCFARNDARISVPIQPFKQLEGTAAHSRGTTCPSLASNITLKIEEGAGNAGSWPPPWPACKQKTQAAVTTGSARSSRHSPHDGLPAYT